jgi:hypothetical protein
MIGSPSVMGDEVPKGHGQADCWGPGFALPGQQGSRLAKGDDQNGMIGDWTGLRVGAPVHRAAAMAGHTELATRKRPDGGFGR